MLQMATFETNAHFKARFEDELTASLGPTETPVKSEREPTGPSQDECLDVHNRGFGYLPIVLNKCFRHSGWQGFRLRVAIAMRSVYASCAAMSAFESCGSSMWILRSTTDGSEYKAVPDYCRSRWCKPCYGARTARLRARLAECLDDKPVRFLTLTLKHSDDSLKDCIDRLYRSFRKLRVSTFWKKRVTGGVALLEIKRGSGSGRWHPHLHCLVQGRYLHYPDLRNEWLLATGDSTNVDIRKVESRSEAIYYVAKYTGKANGMDSSASTEDLSEIIRTLKGRRTVVPYGTWRHFKLLRQEPSDGWRLIGHLNEIQLLALDGDSEAASIIDALQHFHDDPGPVFHIFSNSDPPY